jgi:hypothetical protein
MARIMIVIKVTISVFLVKCNFVVVFFIY